MTPAALTYDQEAWGTHFHKAGIPRPMCPILAADRDYANHMETASAELRRALWRELRAMHERGPL